jgi:hypothetical protein
MPLTLRPTRLYRPAVYAHLKDWEVWEDGKEIGRIMEGREGATKSEQAWFWAITSLEYGMRARARVTTEGTRGRSMRQRPISGATGSG